MPYVPTPKTTPASASPKGLEQRRLFPEETPQGDDRTQDLSECNKANTECGIEEPDKPTDQETALLQWLMQWGTSAESDQADHEVFVKSNFSQMCDTLAKQDDWTPTGKTLLKSMLLVPEENLLQWQDRTKILCLKKLKLGGTHMENNPDAIRITERICECI